MEFLAGLPIANPHTDAEPQGNLLRDYEHKFEQLPEDQKLSKLCSEDCRKRTILHHTE